MSNSYYYLVASLPHAGFGDVAPFTRAEFLEECAKWLSAADFKKLSKAKMDRPAQAALLEDVAAARGARKYPAHLREIFEAPNPLLMEKKFEEKKWILLEEREYGHHFDLEVLIIYLLKLQILERLATFDDKKGEATFEKLVR